MKSFYDNTFWAPTDILMHHGVKGMRWGKRNGPLYPLSSKRKNGTNKTHNDAGKKRALGKSAAKKVLAISGAVLVSAIVATALSSSGAGDKWVAISKKYGSLRARDYQKTKKFKKEYAHAISEIATHIRDDERDLGIIHRPIGNYMYTFENHMDGTFDVLRREKLAPTARKLAERIND